MYRFQERFKNKTSLSENDILRAVQRCLVLREQQILDLNREQLLDGENSEGSIIQVGYSPSHRKKRRKLGLQVGYVDLTLTKDFVRSLQIEFPNVRQFAITHKNSVFYAKYLLGKYPFILGLQRKNKDKIKPLIINELITQIRNEVRNR